MAVNFQPQHVWKPPGRSSRSCYQISLPTTSLSRHVAACTALVCIAQFSMPVRLGIDKGLQRNDRAMIRQICNVQLQDIVTVRFHWLLAWLGIEDLDLILKERRLHWYGYVERSSGAVKTVTDRLMESMRLGGPRWHGSSWQRGIAEIGSSGLWTLWTYLEIWCEICHACSKPVTWKGAHWCGCCPLPVG